MYETILSAIAAIGVPIATYAIIKHETSDEKLLDKVAVLIENIASDEQTLTKIYQIAGVAGAGIAQGTGLSNLTKGKGGKLNLKDMIMQFIIGYAQQKMPSLTGQAEQQAPQSSSTTDTSMGL